MNLFSFCLFFTLFLVSTYSYVHVRFVRTQAEGIPKRANSWKIRCQGGEEGGRLEHQQRRLRRGIKAKNEERERERERKKERKTGSASYAAAAAHTHTHTRMWRRGKKSWFFSSSLLSSHPEDVDSKSSQPSYTRTKRRGGGEGIYGFLNPFLRIVARSGFFFYPLEIFIQNTSYVSFVSPRRWNRTTLPLGSYRFEACTPDHRRSSRQGVLLSCTIKSARGRRKRWTWIFNHTKHKKSKDAQMAKKNRLV